MLYTGNATNIQVWLTLGMWMFSYAEFTHELLRLLNKPDTPVTSVPRCLGPELEATVAPCSDCNGTVQLGLVGPENKWLCRDLTAA